jgi:hypothetical protein
MTVLIPNPGDKRRDDKYFVQILLKKRHHDDSCEIRVPVKSAPG